MKSRARTLVIIHGFQEKKTPPNKDTTRKMTALTKLSVDMAKGMQITECRCHTLRKQSEFEGMDKWVF